MKGVLIFAIFICFGFIFFSLTETNRVPSKQAVEADSTNASLDSFKSQIRHYEKHNSVEK